MMALDVFKPQLSGLDFSILEAEDDYARYFNQLSSVFGFLLTAYGQMGERGRTEATTVSGFLARFLYTVQVLRLKYTYRPAYNRSLWIDLGESGFPNFAEFSNLQAEIPTIVSRLEALPAATLIKRAMLDYMFLEHEKPTELLWQMSERAYLEKLLDTEQLFLPFTSGALERLPDNDTMRMYSYAWGCYDFNTNRPYIHQMMFEHDADQPLLEEKGADYEDFMRVVRGEGNRVPPIGVLAYGIDDELHHVHPKYVKRICLGPVYSGMLLRQRAENQGSLEEDALRDLFHRSGSGEDDIICFFTDEIIISDVQQTVRRGLSLRRREQFRVNQHDPDCVERHASAVHHFVLLPHVILQHVEESDGEQIANIVRSKKIVYDEKGAVYAI